MPWACLFRVKTFWLKNLVITYMIYVSEVKQKVKKHIVRTIYISYFYKGSCLQNSYIFPVLTLSKKVFLLVKYHYFHLSLLYYKRLHYSNLNRHWQIVSTSFYIYINYRIGHVTRIWQSLGGLTVSNCQWFLWLRFPTCKCILCGTNRIAWQNWMESLSRWPEHTTLLTTYPACCAPA